MNSDYQILGLSEGASEAEIKRAYFRLIRQHSPESDPEGFKEIREAYERLKNPGKAEEGPSFSVGDNPMIQYFSGLLQEYKKGHDDRRVLSTAEEAHDIFPDEPYFLYELTIAQRRCGRTGKSVKSAERLLEMDKENKWYWREYGISLMERGFVKKAWQPLCKAYDLGIRNMDFLLLFARECSETEHYERCRDICMERIRRGKKWEREELGDAVELYYLLMESLHYLGLQRETNTSLLYEAIRTYCEFLRTYRLQLKEYLEECISQMVFMINSLREEGTLEIYQECYSALLSFREVCADQKIRDDLNIVFQGLESLKTYKDDRICRSLEYCAEQPLMEGEYSRELIRASYIDAQMCMLEERELIFRVEEVLKEEYIFLYKDIKEFLDSIRDPDRASQIKSNLQNKMRKNPFLEDGNYVKWYPQEKEKLYGKVITRGTETYVRSGRKIGRNDPCPCGSGKKFKQCCAGKGIYD